MTAKVAILDPFQKDLVETLEGLLTRAKSGHLKGLCGVVVEVDDPLDAEAEEDYVVTVAGVPGNTDRMYRRLGHLRKIVDEADEDYPFAKVTDDDESEDG